MNNYSSAERLSSLSEQLRITHQMIDDFENRDDFEEDFHNARRDLMPEITKLNLLNHFLGLEAIPTSDKILLIYEKILEEMNESCDKHTQIADLDKKLSESEEMMKESNAKIKSIQSENRQIDKDLNSQQIREVELKSEYKKLQGQEQDENTFHFRKEDFNDLLAKDNPEKLGEKVKLLIKKLEIIRMFKEKEVKELKEKEKIKKEIIQMTNISQMKDEISHYKERAHCEKLNVVQKAKELESMEAKGSTLKKTLQNDDNKVNQLQIKLENDKQHLQANVQSRYWLLSNVEDSHNEIEGLMSEKQELIRRKRDYKDQLIHLEDKYKEIQSKLAKNQQPAQAAKVNGTSSQKKGKK